MHLCLSLSEGRLFVAVSLSWWIIAPYTVWKVTSPLPVAFQYQFNINVHFLGKLVSMYIDVELVQEGLDIALVIYVQKSSLEVLSEGHIFVAVSLSWWIIAPYTVWKVTSPLPVAFQIVADPLYFSRALLLTPPVLFSILVFVSHSIFWIFQHPGWEVPDVVWISLSGLPFGCVGFIR